MNECEKSTHKITAEAVHRDNSNLWRHNQELAAELKKLRFRKARPDVYNQFCECAGILGAVEPFASMDFQMDIDRYAERLTDARDQFIFQSFLVGRVRQAEIAEMLGCCQATVSNRLRRLVKGFAEYYREEP
jgi:CRP-like cAMP-binding protein